ncbi:MAG: GTP-binding protein [Leptospiraceae bacterium]|nr:GTP-binding protein [Leptospiraceae bacterium]
MFTERSDYTCHVIRLVKYMSMYLVRNIGIYAHIDAGKTTLVENMLYQAGLIDSPGSVLEGTTESDTLLEEIQRGISILSSTFYFKYKTKNKEYSINLIDTPGHLDFTTQVDNSLLAVDIAVLIIDITTGIRSQTEFIFERIRSQGIPLILFINKIDCEHSVGDFLKKIQPYFGNRAYPVYSYDESDIISNIEYIFYKKFEVGEDYLHFIEWNENLTEKYLQNPTKIKSLVLKGLKEGTVQSQITPIFIGSALQGIGVIELLDFICEIEPKMHKIGEDTSAVLFQNRIHPKIGKTSFLKNFSEIYSGDTLFINGKAVYLSNLYAISLDEVQKQEIVPANSIFCSDNVIEFMPGDLLTSQKLEMPQKENFNKRELKQFVLIIEPISDDVRETVINGVKDLVWEGNGLSYTLQEDTGQVELWGAGELHLEISVSRLKKTIGEIFITGNLKVARYEMWKNAINTITFEHSIYEMKVSSGVLKGFVERTESFESPIIFEIDLPMNLKQAAIAGFEEVLSHGYFGHKILGIRLRITSYTSPPIINNQTLSLLKIAVISGIKTLLKEKNTIEIGPLIEFEITVPEEFLGVVMAALQKRDAKVHSMETFMGQKYFVKGEACCENMLGFSSVLRNMTKGKGFFSGNIVLSPSKYYTFSV